LHGHDPEATIGRLRWRCRRGMKELDLLLLRWLEQGYRRSSIGQQQAFHAFLELPDPLIAAYLLGRETPDEPEVRALVEAITACAQAPGT
jgi:antitoxin CptB